MDFEEIKTKLQEMKIENKLLVIGMTGLVIVSVLSIFLFGLIPKTFYLISIGLFASIIPYFYIKYKYLNKYEEMEERFPEFARDLSEAKKSGMTLPQAIKMTSDTDYGALSEEVNKMANHLGWGRPFPEVIRNFISRVKRSEMIRRAMTIVMEAQQAGGDVGKTLDSVASTTITLRDIKKDRESIFKEQAVVVFMVNFIFLGIIVALYQILIPLMSVQSTSVGGMSFFSTEGGPGIEYYKMLFFLAMMVESICNGMLAGQVRKGRLLTGIKYAIILGGISLFVFGIFILPSSITVEFNARRDYYYPGDEMQLYGSVSREGEALSEKTGKIYHDGDLITVISTDESGKFNIEMNAPKKPGNYTYTMKVKHENYEGEGKVKIEVRSL